MSLQKIKCPKIEPIFKDMLLARKIKALDKPHLWGFQEESGGKSGRKG